MEGKKRFNVYMDFSLYEQVQKEAKRLGLSVSSFINVAASQYVQQSSITSLVDFFKQYEEQAKDKGVDPS